MNKLFIITFGVLVLTSFALAKKDEETRLDTIFYKAIEKDILSRGEKDLQDCLNCVPSVTKAIIKCIKQVPMAQISKCVKGVLGAYDNCLDCICVILNGLGIPCN